MAWILHLSVATVDLGRREVRRGGEVLPLSELEVSLLAWLAAHPGEPADRDRLLVEVWGYPRAVETRAVDNTVSRLRVKIEHDAARPDHLRTVRGRGYVLDLPASALQECSQDGPAIDGLTVAGNQFLGRAAELSELSRLVERNRILTIMGAGGAGKTRLLARWLRDCRAPLHAVLSLADVGERAGLRAELARALDLGLTGAERDDTVIARALAARGPGLLVLDNMEQLVASSSQVLASWLAAAPGLRLLATSRVALGLPGELRFPVGPMLPVDSLSLFEARLSEARDGRPLGAEERAAAADLMERVEHHPLCIELLAVHAGTIGLAAVARRLEQTLAILDLGGPEHPERHRSLQATLRWSWELLSAPDQEALACLGAFGGAFDPELARAAIGADAAVRLDALAGASLVERDASGGSTSYTLLLPVRAFARERLAERSDRARVFERLGEALASRCRLWTDEPDASAWRARQQAVPNLVSTGEALASSDPVRACQLLLTARGGDSLSSLDGPEPLERLVALAERTADPALCAWARSLLSDWLRYRNELERALFALRPILGDEEALRSWPQARISLARVLHGLGQHEQSVAALDRVLAQEEVVGPIRVRALSAQGIALQFLGQATRSEECFRSAVSLAVRLGARRAEAEARSNLAALILRDPAREPEAREEVSLALALDTVSPSSRAWRLNLLGWLDLLAGDLDSAGRLAGEALRTTRLVGHEQFAQQALGTLCWVSALRGDAEEAEHLLREALEMSHGQGNAGYTAALRVSLGGIVATRGRLAEGQEECEGGIAMIDERFPADLVAGMHLQAREIDLVRAAGGGPHAVALRADVEAHLARSQCLVSTSSYVRLVARRLEAVRAAAGPPPAGLST